jgi:glycine/D-amino acid oxidase-like deaminating enzyme
MIDKSGVVVVGAGFAGLWAAAAAAALRDDTGQPGHRAGSARRGSVVQCGHGRGRDAARRTPAPPVRRAWPARA